MVIRLAGSIFLPRFYVLIKIDFFLNAQPEKVTIDDRVCRIAKLHYNYKVLSLIHSDR